MKCNGSIQCQRLSLDMKLSPCGRKRSKGSRANSAINKRINLTRFDTSSQTRGCTCGSCVNREMVSAMRENSPVSCVPVSGT